ncbi:MAG: phage holin family protein [Chloroflexota bacterium]
MIRLVIRWLLSALALVLIAKVVPGIHVTVTTALIAAIVLGLINAFLRPGFILLTLPLTIVTLGLFVLVINAALFGLAAWLVPGFIIHGFRAALVGAILYAIAGWLINLAVDRGNNEGRKVRARVTVRYRRT